MPGVGPSTIYNYREKYDAVRPSTLKHPSSFDAVDNLTEICMI